MTAADPAYLTRFASPIGRIEITSDGESITSLAIERDGVLPNDPTVENDVPVLELARIQVGEYLSGERIKFDLPLHLGGTTFQKAVWTELARVPFGETTSYGALGRATGRATAGRAVGGAIGANPIPLIIACHRVLASDQKITGYSAGNGVPTKIWLLDHEGIAHK